MMTGEGCRSRTTVPLLYMLNRSCLPSTRLISACDSHTSGHTVVESHLHEEVDRDCALFFFFFSVAVAASGLQNSLREAKPEHIFIKSARRAQCLRIVQSATTASHVASRDSSVYSSFCPFCEPIYHVFFWEGRYRVSRSRSALTNFLPQLDAGLKNACQATVMFLDEWPLRQKKELIRSTSRSESQKAL